jgi:hypothetical protein
LPSPSSLARSRPEAGAARRRRLAGLPATAAASERGERREGDGGILLPYSPWARTRCGGGSAAAADRWCWPTVVARCGCAAKQWRVAVAWWCGEDGAGLFIAGVRSVRERFFMHTGAPARSTPASSSTFARRRPVTRLLGQRRQVNSCRRGDGSACAAGRGVDGLQRRQGAVVPGGSDGSRRGAVLRRGTEVGSTVACGWG